MMNSKASDGNGERDFGELVSGGVNEDLIPAVYGELRRIARQQRSRGMKSPTLNTTALVHEAYVSLAKATSPQFKDAQHFFAVAAIAMRRLLIHEARRYATSKRGDGERPLSLEDRDIAVQEQSAFLLDLDQALSRLGEFNPRLQQVIECRFFGGLTEEETATALGVTSRTVRRDWIKARGWLHMELGAPAAGEQTAGELTAGEQSSEP